MLAVTRSYERYVIALLLGLLAWSTLDASDECASSSRDVVAASAGKPSIAEMLRKETPQPFFRGNLRSDLAYATSFAANGFTNQVVTAINLAYLGRLLDRTIIIPDLEPAHEEGSRELMSTFFDLATFAADARINVTEWRNVKLTDDDARREELSCWGHWRETTRISQYNIDVTFWEAPRDYMLTWGPHTLWTFHGVQTLTMQPQTTWIDEIVTDKYRSPKKRPRPPDEQLLCLDEMFAMPPSRFERGAMPDPPPDADMMIDSTLWNAIGTHLRFTDAVGRVTDELLLQLLGKKRAAFIAVHIRQGDFVTLGRVKEDLLDRFERAVSEVRQEQNNGNHAGSALTRPDLTFNRFRSRLRPSLIQSDDRPAIGDAMKLPVLFATDSTDVATIGRYLALGWTYIDHGAFKTKDRFNGWWPSVIDSAILSRAVGFVGTRQSTFSSLAAMRVENWQHGVTRIVGW